MRCEACGAKMVSLWSWNQGSRPEGFVPYGGQGLCKRDYNRLRRTGSTDEPELRLPPRERRNAKGMRDSEEVLEEWMLIKSRVRDLSEAAQIMGMTTSALDKVLYRARKTGDTRGNVPFSPHIRRSA